MNKRERARDLLFFAFCFSAFAAVYVQYQLPPIAGELTDALGLSPSQYSSAFSGPLIPSIALSVLCGILVDRFGVMPIVIVGSVIATTASGFRIASNSYPSLLITMILAGILPTLLNVNVSKMLSSYYPTEALSQRIGFFYGSSMLGMAVGTATTALFPSFRAAFGMGAVVMLVSLALLLSAGRQASKAKPEAPSAKAAPKGRVLTILKNPTVLCIGLMLSAIMANSVALSGFLPNAISSKGLDTVMAGFYTSVFLVGNIASTAFLPKVADKLGSVKKTVVLSALISAVGAAFATALPTGVPLAMGLFVTGLFSNGLIPLLMSLPVRLSSIGPENAGTACGIINTFQMAGGVIIPTYILTPLTKGNYFALFRACGILLVLVAVLALLLPDLSKQAKDTHLSHPSPTAGGTM